MNSAIVTTSTTMTLAQASAEPYRRGVRRRRRETTATIAVPASVSALVVAHVRQTPQHTCVAGA